MGLQAARGPGAIFLVVYSDGPKRAVALKVIEVKRIK